MMRLLVTMWALLGALTATHVANAQSIIKRPGLHPDYVFELEPHFSLAPYSGGGVGFGLRGAVQILENGFVPTINNSVAIGFGMDWVFFPEHCHGAPRGNPDCHHRNDLIFPVVLQWNFYPHRKWSVFAEPGFGFRVINWEDNYHDDHFDMEWVVFYAGGRYYFNDNITLTMRLGYPTFSVGVSFLF